MTYRLTLALLVVAVLYAQPAGKKPRPITPGPTEFYVVAEAFSDAAPFWSYYVLDVKPDGDGSALRYTRIAPLSAECSAVTVKATQVRIGVSPTDLANGINLCAVTPRALYQALTKYGRGAYTIFEAVRFGIVANCGSEQVVLRIPYSEAVDYDRLKKKSPEIARLWDMFDDVKTRAFADKAPLYYTSKEQDMELQRAGQSVLPELRSGKFDAGLAPDCSKKPCKAQSFRDTLNDYKGPQEKPTHAPQLLNADAFQFARYADPVYPPLARQARIQGKVELNFAVDSQTGDVQGVTVLSGHTLLVTPAVEAVKQWRLAPRSLGGTQILHATIDFAFRCP